MNVRIAGSLRAAVRHALCGGVCSGLAVLLAVPAVAEETIRFVAPAGSGEPSTLSVTEPGALRPAAAPTPSVVATPAAEPLDLAMLANFAQSAAEEIAGEPVAPGDRPYRPITQVTIDAALPAGSLPGDADVRPEGFIESPPLEFADPRQWGGWADVNFEWSATMLCHRPLYFEQVNVERYGYTVSPLLQPAISGAHFFLTIPTMPYKLVAQPPRECVYTLGYYRAGSRVPRRWHHVNWDPTAATVEGLVVTGLVFLIP
jgi:hypothetical protein